MERLWAPWRGDYVAGAGPQGCLFCRVIEDGAAKHRDNLVLAESDAGLVMLNRYPYNTGHVMVAPRAHAASPEDLPEAAAGALDALLRAALRAVRAAYRPDGVNVGTNLGRCAGAGVPDHCHWHVVPRWNGDTNFMPVVGAVKVMPESLETSYDRLRPFY